LLTFINRALEGWDKEACCIWSQLQIVGCRLRIVDSSTLTTDYELWTMDPWLLAIHSKASETAFYDRL
jgi:hypothetical protein